MNSHIGYGSPHKQDTNAAHGEPLGEEEVKLAKKIYGWPEDAKFLVPDGVLEHFQEGIGKRGGELRAEVGQAVRRIQRRSFPTWRTRSTACSSANCPTDGTRIFPPFPPMPKGVATRESGGKVLNAIAQNIPWLIGGSADLATSNKTTLKFDGAGRLPGRQLWRSQFPFRRPRTRAWPRP